MARLPRIYSRASALFVHSSTEDDAAIQMELRRAGPSDLAALFA
jgi:hypothetical protein